MGILYNHNLLQFVTENRVRHMTHELIVIVQYMFVSHVTGQLWMENGIEVYYCAKK